MSRRTLGQLGIAAGITGVLSAIVMLAWPVQSPPGLVRYPFTPAQFYAIQTWFFIHHLGMAAVLVGLARSDALGKGRIARGAAWLAVAGAGLLAVMELVTAACFGEANLDAANHGALGAGYGASTNLIGLGMIGAGVATVRVKAWTGWSRWIPLAIGAFHFAVVTPCVFSGNFVAGRLGIGSWLALFGALGWALVRADRRDEGQS